MSGHFAEQPKKVAIITRWPYYRGGCKAMFHCNNDHLTRFGFQALAIVPIVCRILICQQAPSLMAPYIALTSLFKQGCSKEKLSRLFGGQAGFVTQLYLQNNISPGLCFPEQFERFVSSSFSPWNKPAAGSQRHSCSCSSVVEHLELDIIFSRHLSHHARWGKGSRPQLTT